MSVCYPKTHMLGAIAQLETELRAERQRDAIQDARARGVTCGRTKRLTSQQSLELWNRRQQGAPIKRLMADYGLSNASCIVTSADRPPHRQPRPSRALEYTFSRGYAKNPGPIGRRPRDQTFGARSEVP